MPEAIVFVAKWAAGAVFATTGSAAAAAAVGNFILAAATFKGMLFMAAVGYSSVQQRKMKRRMNSMRNEGRIFTVREATASRPVIYGRQRVGGSLVFAHVAGGKREYLYMVIALAGHEVEAIGDIYIGDEVQTFDGSGNATGNLEDFCRVRKFLGTDSQTVGESTFDTEIPTKWDDTRRLRGIACLEGQLKWNVDKFPTGIPNISAIVSGKKLYDPRTDTTEYSDNPALCVRDYLTNKTYGIGATDAEIDDDSISAAANICDEEVSIAGGGTEKRYTCNGVIDPAVMPAENLEAILASMAGIAIFSAGKWRVSAGAHRASSATFTIDDVRGPISLQTAGSRRDSCNAVKGIYLSEDTQWQPTDLPHYIKTVTAPNITAGAPCTILSVGDTDFTAIGAASNTVGITFTATGAGTGTGTVDPYLGADNGERVWRDIELPFTISAAMGQRLEKIELERSRQDLVVSLPLKLCGLKVKAGDTVALTIARYGWTEKLFTVEDWSFAIDEQGDAPTLGVDLVLRETAAAVWDWSSAEETTVDLAPNTDLPSPRTVAAPTFLSIGHAGYVETDGTWLPRISVGWTLPSDEFVQSGGHIRMQYKKAADSDWLEWGLFLGSQDFDYITDVLAGASYDIRIRSENALGVASAWLAGSGTAPLRTVGPPDYDDLVLESHDGTPPNFSSGSRRYAVTFYWAEEMGSTNYVYPSDFLCWECKGTATDSDSATDYNVDQGPGNPSLIRTVIPRVHLYVDSPVTTYFRLRAVNRSGVASGWFSIGPFLTTDWVKPGGDMMEQGKDDVTSSGISIGDTAASSVRKVLARYSGNDAVPAFTGGSQTETFTISLANRGFSAAPDAGTIICIDPPGELLAAYYIGTGTNSSTSVTITARTIDGSNISAAPRRFSFEFIEHD